MVGEVKPNETIQPKESGKAKRFIRAMIALLSIVFTFYLFKEVLIPTSANPNIENNKEIVMYILGALTSVVVQIIGFYFGSSEADSKSS